MQFALMAWGDLPFILSPYPGGNSMHFTQELKQAMADRRPSSQRQASMNKLLLTAVSLAICSSGAGATLVTQSTAMATPVAISASDTSAGATPVSNSATRSLSFNQFNADLGVLTGVTSGLTLSAGQLNLSANGTYSTTPAGNPTYAATGSISASPICPASRHSGYSIIRCRIHAQAPMAPNVSPPRSPT